MFIIQRPHTKSCKKVQPVVRAVKPASCLRIFPGRPSTATSSIPREYWQLSIDRIGDDLPARILELADGTQDIVHADINLGDPGVNHAIDVLSSHRFVYCGWLPNFGGNDVLRLQRIDNLTERELNPNLVTSEAKVLLAQIKSGG